MATSGTIGNTVIDVTTVIETAFRRCGKLPSTVSAELQLAARDDLHLMLTGWSNRGLSLWCIQKYVIGVIPHQAYFDLPIGVVDVLSMLWRTKTDLDGTTITGTGWQGLTLTEATEVDVASIMFTSASAAPLVVESSDDAVTWTQRAAFDTPNTATPAGTWRVADVDNSVEALHWRVRDTTGTALPTVDRLTFSTTDNEIPMAALNRDQYVALPNKTFSVPEGTNLLQFWYDKQVQPRVWVWPQSQGYADQMVLWAQRHIQDVGALTNTLDVPNRWLDAVIFGLAEKVALQISPKELPPGRLDYLVSKAADALVQAEDGESDGSASLFTPNIQGYVA